MIAIAQSEIRTDKYQARFLEMLPSIRKQARAAFRSTDPEAREEFVAEVVANTYRQYCRLVELGKRDLAFATPLTQFAVRQVRSGRRVGGSLSARDVTSPHAQRMNGYQVVQLDEFDGRCGGWREVLVEDKHAGPAETAAARIDVAAWFRSLPRRNRRIAKLLARGEATSSVARMFDLSGARISQLRRELQNSWAELQDEAVMG